MLVHPLVSKNSLVPEVLRTGIHQPCGGPVGLCARGSAALHRSGETGAECVHRKLQREVPRRMLEPELVREPGRRATNDRSLARGLQHGASAQQLGLSNAGRVRGQRRRPTGVSPHVGRTNHPGRDTNELAGIPQCYIMTGPITGGRSGRLHRFGMKVSNRLVFLVNTPDRVEVGTGSTKHEVIVENRKKICVIPRAVGILQPLRCCLFV